ncbi:DUF1566 domain-containing protein [Leptospira perolatii]|uniref:Lcl C-terminal domain-containing protein n=1 Tax=Leptospira perolatii TaxID=2023191 RepID=UPI0013FDA280|nr:DUF1566 domain-containing protein [Leptospira perolatii]
MSALLFCNTAALAIGPYQDGYAGAGTVRDQSTGLVWQKCSMGQTNNSSCSGTPGTVLWDAALTYCTGLSLGGRTWRLPNVNELLTIVDYSKYNPAIDTSSTAFINTPAWTDYWTSTSDPNIGIQNAAMYVSFIGGNVTAYIKGTTSISVRCVSGPP